MEIEYENEKIIVYEGDENVVKEEKKGQGTLVIEFKDDTELKELGPIELLGFGLLKDHLGDEVFYCKVRPDKKMVLYHMTKHPDSIMALRALKIKCKEEGYTCVDLRDYLVETLKYVRDKKKKEE